MKRPSPSDVAAALSATPVVHSIATPAALLVAPTSWRCVDFIADVHLQPGDEATFGLWRDYLEGTRADALFILGDLFEVWVGDDISESWQHPTEDAQIDQACAFAARCAGLLRQASRRLALYFVHGNRDFLIGTNYLQACGMTLLEDPSVLEFGGQRYLLSHGDQFCLADAPYMQLRPLVRSARWQAEFLARPLSKRLALARDWRQQSEAHKLQVYSEGAAFADVDAAAACSALRQSQAQILIHGHTHQAGEHALGNGLQRLVLSDWDAHSKPMRASILRLGSEEAPPGRGIQSFQRIAAATA